MNQPDNGNTGLLFKALLGNHPDVQSALNAGARQIKDISGTRRGFKEETYGGMTFVRLYPSSTSPDPR